ncbi:MAG: hypothetical protein U1E54_01290 [Candidatus Levybacteria bacterium]|nr:hypothetical protein [Candidatus Levybacteria bacterium]
MTEPIEKMPIEKDNNTLKIYMFTVQTGPVQIAFPEDFKAVMAYNDSDAALMVSKDYPQGTILHVKKRAQVEVKRIVDALNLQPAQPQEVKMILPPPDPTPQKTKKQEFINGMMLVVEKYVESKRDRTIVKNIINKIT